MFELIKERKNPILRNEKWLIRQLREDGEDDSDDGNDDSDDGDGDGDGDGDKLRMSKGAEEIHNEIVDSILKLPTGNNNKREGEKEDGEDGEEGDNNSEDELTDFSENRRNQPTVNLTSTLKSVHHTVAVISIQVTKPSLLWCEATDRGKELIASSVRNSKEGTLIKSRSVDRIDGVYCIDDHSLFIIIHHHSSSTIIIHHHHSSSLTITFHH